MQALGLDGTWQSTATGFNAPREIAVGPDGAVYVADTGNGRVQRRDPASGAWTTFAAGLSSPAGVAVTSDAVYVADTGNNRIQRIAATTTTTLPTPPGGLTAPTGVAAAGGAVYVADTGANRVLRFNEGSGTWDVIGTDGTGAGQFIAPHGLALDTGATTLVVADTGNDRLQRITLSGTPRAALVRLDTATAGTGTGSVPSAPDGDLVPDRLPPGLQLPALSCACRHGRRAARPSPAGRARAPAPGRARCPWAPSAASRRPSSNTSPPTPPAAPPTAGPGPTSQPAPSGAANASVRDRTAPSLRGVSLRPRRLRAARRGATIAAVATRRDAALRAVRARRAEHRDRARRRARALQGAPPVRCAARRRPGRTA